MTANFSQRYYAALVSLYLVLSCVFLSLSPRSSYAQNRKLDSLRQVLDTLPKSDQNRYVKVLWDMVNILSAIDETQSTKYAEEAYKVSLTGSSLLLQYDAMTVYAQHLTYLDKLDSAELILRDLMSLMRMNKPDSFALVKYYDISGSIARRRTKIQEAADYYDSAMSIAKGMGKITLQATILQNLAALYHEHEKFDLAIEYYKQSLVINKRSQKKIALSSTYTNLATIYNEEGDYQAGELYADSAISIKEQLGNTESLAFSYCNAILNAVIRTGDLRKANQYLLKLEAIESGIKSQYHKGYVHHAKSNYYLKTGNLSLAFAQAEGAYQAGKEQANESLLTDAYDDLIESSAAMAEFGKAYQFLQAKQAFKDSINQVEEEKALLELQTKYETSQKEAENLRLQQINVQQATLNRVLGAGGGFLALFLVALGYLYYRQNKQKRTIENQAAELRKLNDMKSEFFASISHELRTPLTLVKGNIETTVRGKHLMAEDEHKLNNARRNLTQLSGMIDDLLDLSKLELGQYNLKLQPVLISQFLSRTVSSFQSLSEDKKIALIFEDKLNGDRYAQIDTRQFGKVVNNLIYNAFKFSSENDTITIVLQEREGMLKVTVSDEGIGIPPKDLPHIFDRFYQGDNKVEEQGSGLGLAIAKEITVMHGGTLEAKSIERVGTELILSLPLTEAKDEVTHAEEVFDLTDAVGEKLRAFSVEKPALLVVEDNRQMQEYLREILSKYFSVTVKSNGRECLSWLKGNIPVLIISDVMMPEMDGFELLSTLKQSAEYRNIPVILLTAKSGYDDRLKGLRLGVDDYITKPFDQDELLIKTVNLVNNLQHRIKWTREIGAEAMKTEPFSQADELLVSALEEYIKGRISDPKISVAELANLVSMSERQLYRRLAGINGMSPAQLIMEVRLQYARTLLLNGGIVKLSQLAMEVGIGTPAYLSKMFYDRFGKRPTEFI